jgi:hypothetical protein
VYQLGWIRLDKHGSVCIRLNQCVSGWISMDQYGQRFDQCVSGWIKLGQYG